MAEVIFKVRVRCITLTLALSLERGLGSVLCWLDQCVVDSYSGAGFG